MSRVNKLNSNIIGRNGKKKYHKGPYHIQNPEKYIGDPTQCIYESSWEMKFMVYLDLNTSISRWGSEIIVIPYQDEKGKYHRYHTDFYYEKIDESNPEEHKRVVVEIKPDKETRQPNPPKDFTPKKLESFEYQLKTYQKNLYKWTRSIEWCKKNKMEFIIITEKHLKKYGIM